MYANGDDKSAGYGMVKTQIHLDAILSCTHYNNDILTW